MKIIRNILLAIGGLLLCISYSLAQEVTLKVEYTSYDLRDPFKNPLLEEEEVEIAPSEPETPIEEIFLPTELEVKGIVWGIEPVKAIINDEVVGRGDTVLDARVLDIKKDGVHLLYKGKKFIVKPQ